MVKNKNDKTKLSNWEEGDIFALKIKSEKYPEYNNRYIILIHCPIKKEGWQTKSRTINTFRAKITENSVLPSTKEEIEKLEYIKTSTYRYILERNRFPDDTEYLTPDEYHIYTYLLRIKALKYKIPKNLLYQGNFDVIEPKNEYIPSSQHNGILFSFWKGKYSNVIDYLLDCYEWYNLKKAIFFDKKLQKKYQEQEQKDIQFFKYLKKLQEDIEGPNGKEILKSMGIDIDKEKRTKHNETYVGSKKISTRKKQK